MTTAAQYLVALSGLSGVSAGEHLMAITAGTGETIFANQMTLVSEVPQAALYRKPKRAIPRAEPKPAVQAKKGTKHSFLVAERNEQVVLTETEEVWLINLPKQVATVLTHPNQVFTSRRKAN